MPEIYEQRLLEAKPEELAILLGKPTEWLEDVAGRASTFGSAVDVRLRGELGLGRIHPGLAKRARLEVGSAQLVRDHFVVPITWEAVGFAGLFPVMDALFEIHKAPNGKSRVVFWGRYDPPLGRAGEAMDRYVAHRVAEATVRQLLDALEEHVRAGAAEVRA